VVADTSIRTIGVRRKIRIHPAHYRPQAKHVKLLNKPRGSRLECSGSCSRQAVFCNYNLDKSSGLINISYSGEPEKYIDCGRVISYVKNARGERTYDFPGARANQQYQVMNDSGLFFLDRKMALEGRMNLIFEEIGPDKTQVTANSRYVITRTEKIQSAGSSLPQHDTGSISLNSGQSGSFPPDKSRGTLECVPTGRFESDVLSLID
jgi:hypothetical protein